MSYKMPMSDKKINGNINQHGYVSVYFITIENWVFIFPFSLFLA